MLPGPTPGVYTLDQGERTITLKRKGYVTVNRTHNAQRDGEVVIVTLERQAPGTLRIVVIPYGDIYIDDKKKGEGQEVYEARHAVGTRTVRIVHPTLGFVERDVEITSGQTLKISINMRTEGRQP